MKHLPTEFFSFLRIATILALTFSGFDLPAAHANGNLPLMHEFEHILVNTTADTVDNLISNDICADVSGNCSLRAAVQNANLWPGGQTIELDDETYTLTRAGVNENAASTGDLDVTGAITITGGGLSFTVINANDLDRVLDVRPGAEVQVYGLSLTNGNAPAIDDYDGRRGGGIFVAAGSSLTMGNVGVYSSLSGLHYYWNDDAGDGGGIYNDGGTLDFSYVEIKGNATRNGNSTASSGMDGGKGAGLFSNAGIVEIDHGTISGNVTGNGGSATNSNSFGGDGGSGAGIYMYGGVITVTNTMVEDNITGKGGDGVYVSTAGGGSGGWGAGIYFGGGHLSISDSVIQENTTGGGGGGCRDASSYNFLCEAGGAAGLYVRGESKAHTMDVSRTTISGNVVGPPGGVRAEGAEGGGIFCSGATLNLTDTIVENNQAGNGAGVTWSGWGGDGGGLYLLDCAASIVRGAVRGNHAGDSGAAVNVNTGGYGGGLRTYSGGSLTITDTTISGNFAGDTPGVSAGGAGGGLFIAANATLSGVTISDNHAGTSATYGLGDGGGISASGNVTVTNSTVSGNFAGMGGGINSPGTLTLRSSTIVNNTATKSSGIGGISANGTVLNSIIANNSAPFTPDCSSISSLGYNLVESMSCYIAGEIIGVVSGQDPQLGPLQDNGGPAFTHMLTAASPALDAANPNAPGSGGNACQAADQRGLTRSVMRCDMGAVEAQIGEIPNRVVRLMTTNVPATYGPQMASAELKSGDSFYLGVLRSPMTPSGVPVPAGAMEAFWSLTYESAPGAGQPQPPVFSLDLSLCYLEAELGAAEEQDLYMLRWDGEDWVEEGGVLDSEKNCLTKTGVTMFSVWTLAADTEKAVFLPVIVR